VALVILFILSLLGLTLANNTIISYDEVWHYQFTSVILSGLLTTIKLTVLSQAAAVIIGILVAVAGLSENPVLAVCAKTYIWFFRGTPVLVQLIFWFNLAVIFPTFSIGIPFGAVFFSTKMNAVMTGFVAALLGFSLNHGAYMAETVRAGILSVDKGQRDAALALGYRRRQVMFHVVLPQAIPVIIPPTGNELIALLKATSLVSVIGGGDLLTQAENIYSTNYLVLELLIVASIWYLALTTVATFGQRMLERHVGRSRETDGSRRRTTTDMGIGRLAAVTRAFAKACRRAPGRPLGE